VEIADANPIVVTQLSHKERRMIPKFVPIKIFKDNNFARTGVR
jgi:hypothetical protein